ncbi:hypothetical protein GCM10009839_81820 [Catenulispora yoronensis]|uniref:Uncharacterized protein n=1 Tax=Catenulispora yoronensis TaxID=450799 RepID=A0ABP5GWF8_9ACTN
MKRHLASALAGLAATSGLTLGLTISTASTAAAYSACKAGTECSWVYYTSAAHTVATGVRGYDCSGNPFSWGTTSPYVVYEVAGCGGGGPVD